MKISLISILAIVALICATNCTIESSPFEALYMKNNERTYAKLDSYLDSELKYDEDVGRNLNTAIEWLEYKSSSHSNPVSRSKYKAALKQMQRLKGINEELKCDESSYTVVIDTNKAKSVHKQEDRTQRSLRFQENKLRRIDKIFNEVYKNHSDRCLRVYEANFEFKYKQMSASEPIKKAEVFANGYLNSIVGFIQRTTKDWSWSACERDNLRDKIANLGQFSLKSVLNIKNLDERKVFDALKYFAKQDADVSCLNNHQVTGEIVNTSDCRDKIEALFNRYILEPCKQFTRVFGPEVFTPSSFGSSIENWSELNDTKRVLEMLDYYIGRATHQLCSMTENKSKDLLSEIKAISEQDR